MAKHLSHPKIGINTLLEQTFFKLFTPAMPKIKGNNKLSFVATPALDTEPEPTINYASEMPAEQPKQRIKKEQAFKFDEAAAQLKPESKPKPEYSELKPEIKLMHTGFNIAINFANNFKLPAKIYGRRGFEKEFKFLALDTFSPYMDNRPKLDSNLPEEREYKVIFFDEDSEVGKMSEIVKITI